MQEQQEPVPIHIRIDTQEQRSGISDLLASMPQVHVEVTPLRIGDYDECRRRPTCDGPRCRARASRCAGTAAACGLANLT
ncbi:MAG TPA: hypothetical protein VF026_06835 [Ktedonobacteraceae bacterium]